MVKQISVDKITVRQLKYCSANANHLNRGDIGAIVGVEILSFDHHRWNIDKHNLISQHLPNGND